MIVAKDNVDVMFVDMMFTEWDKIHYIEEDILMESKSKKRNVWVKSLFAIFLLLALLSSLYKTLSEI